MFCWETLVPGIHVGATLHESPTLNPLQAKYKKEGTSLELCVHTLTVQSQFQSTVNPVRI